MRGQFRLSGIPVEARIVGALLALVPMTLIAAGLHWSPALQFALAIGALIPLATFISWSTEALTTRYGGKIGGLVNATFGNAPEVLIGVFGVSKGLIPLVKASLIGAMISNSALTMGICYLIAGLRQGRVRFRREEAGHHSVLLMLTLAAVLFPSIGSYMVCGGPDCGDEPRRIIGISVGIAVVVLLAYCAYVVFGIFGWRAWPTRKAEGEEADAIVEQAEIAETTPWPIWLSLTVLGGATLALVPVTDILTSAVTPVTQAIGWSQVFVGVVIVANAGNAAESVAAIRMAWKQPSGMTVQPGDDSGLDLALGISSASSVQIATFAAPLIVLFSLSSHPMTLVFSPVEIAIFGILVLIFTFIAQDGESNWLEGAQLLALYAMAAIVFYALPQSLFGE